MSPSVATVFVISATLEMKSLCVGSLKMLFSHCGSCLCVLLLASRAVQKLVSWTRSPWFMLALRISVAMGE